LPIIKILQKNIRHRDVHYRLYDIQKELFSLILNILKTKTSFQKDSILKVTACAFLLSMYLFRISYNVVDLDIWHQMALIREAIALGHFPLEDHFAYTTTVVPVVHHEWGAGAIAYFLATTFGAPGILLTKYVLAILIAGFSLLCLRKRSVSVEILIYTMPIGILLIDEGFSTIRGQMYSFAFAACLIWLFEFDRDKGQKWLLAWNNLHAGFLVGIGLFGAYWLEKLIQKKSTMHLVAAGIAILCLMAVTPYGLEYYSYLWRAIFMPRPYVNEWNPIWLGLHPIKLSIFALSLVLLIYSVIKVGIRNTQGLPLLLMVGLASIFTTRIIFFYAIAWTCFVPGYIQGTPLGFSMNYVCRKLSRLISMILIVFTIVFFVRGLLLNPWKLLVPSEHIKGLDNHMIYPVGSVEYLAEIGFKGNLLVTFDWGAYVMWKLHPQVRVSMDSRYEAAYPAWLVDENYSFFMARENWQNILKAYPTDLVLIPKTLPLALVMPQQKEWKKVYTDRTSELYARPGLELPVVDRSDRIFTGIFP
jgi:hypothetical protein